MSRLPTPGSDDDIWGNILNDFLDVAHNSDGTLKDAGKIASAVQTVNGKTGPTVTLTAADVGAAADSGVVHNTGNENVGGVKTFSASPIVPTPTSGTQAANKSYVDSVAGGGGGGSSTLAGDTDVAIASPATNEVLTYNGVSSKWENKPAPSAPVTSVAGKTGAVTLAEGDITNLTSDLAAKAPLASPTFTGTVTVPSPLTSTDAATKGYVDSQVSSATAPDATASTKGVVQLAGDLGGTASVPTVPALANKVGTSRQVSTSGSLSGGGDLSADRTLALVNDSSTPGNSQYYGTDGAGAKGYHALPTGDPAMGGDLSGTASNAQIVAGAVGNTELAASAIDDGKVSATANIAQSKIANLTSDLAGKASTGTTVTGATSLTGGGDLSANRSISLVNDLATPGNNQYYGTDGTGTKGYHGIPSAPDATAGSKGIVQLAGDLSGTATAPTVTSTSLASALPINQGGTAAGTAQGALNNLLPTQTGNGGKVLQTDGTNASWAAPQTDQDIYALTWMEVGS